MAAECITVGPDRPSPSRLTALPLILGFATLLVPTVVTLGRQSWNQESGSHGPIVLATGVWLLWRGLPRDAARPGALGVSAIVLAGALVIYVTGRVFGFLSFEAAGLYGAGVAILYSQIGGQALARLWFPVAYLGFLIPPPGFLLDRVTAPLKQFVSYAATGILSATGVPVSREGVTLEVAQYRLLVEDACSGLNSIIGLLAVSLLYVHLLRSTTWRYAILLAACAAPIAILGNIIRIMVLILLTYFFGDEVAQGFLHLTAGFFLFALDLILIFATDRLLYRAVPESWRAA
jgi:exosortase